MEPFYLFECVLYALLNFLPCMLLAMYPFRNQLRSSKAVTAIGIALNALVHICMNIAKLHTDLNMVLTFTCSVIHVLFMFVWLKAHWGKALFTLLMLTNISNFIIISSKCLEGLLFPGLALEHYHWTNSLTMAIMDVVVLTPVFFFFKKAYAKALEQEGSTTMWRYLWLIPLTFYSVWFRNFYFSQEGAVALSLRPQHTLFSLVVNGGAMLMYALIVQLVNEYTQNQQLRDREHQLLLQQAQYTNLHDRIEEARRAKHDMRQHMHVIAAYLKDQKYDQLEEYVNRYRKSLPEEDTLQYCKNFAVNALLQYFSGHAKLTGSGFSARMELPENTGIPDEAMTVVLGNLLENAIEACVAQGKGSVVSVWGKTDGTAVFFKVVNTCPLPPKTDKQGRFLSSKRAGYGIGLSSVQNLAQQYNGMMKTTWENGTFVVSVLLNIPEN